MITGLMACNIVLHYIKIKFKRNSYKLINKRAQKLRNP